ncbi:MAG: class I SAM-dependent methyltransferase [Rhodospirillales bacterium]
MSELKMDACPICSAPVSLWNSKTTEAGEFKLDRCQDCSYVFVNPRPSLEYLVDFYTNNTHDNSFRDEAEVSLSDILKKEADWPNSSVDAERIVGTAHSLVKTTSPEGALTLFDVACGFGFITREAINLGFDVTALEISNSDRKIASDMNNLEPQNIPFEEFNEADNSFDVIILSQIVEHVLDINEWIGKAQKLLKSDGLLAVALPNFDNLFRYILGKNEPYIIPPEHLNYFNGRNLQKLLSNHGLSVEKIEWTSKVAPSAVRKLPLGKLAEPIFAPLVGISLNLIDLLHLEIFVTVYARKK